MFIQKIENDKKQFLDLLLLADEQEHMIDRYLEKGEMFGLFDDGLKSICVVTNEGSGFCELKNIATYEAFQGKGYGKHLLSFILQHYKGLFNVMYVGTGDHSAAASFYTHFGFQYSHRLRNFFPDHYDYPIYEQGKQLVDMIYFKKKL
ncbi:MAG TPA: GNAT family N-acetyltransferase [Flavisolibacter sp.]|jgi:GNAT superfamily N-acetyltransferase|nr:GNAT family N-acetyltransferase [Flavisolibacter sp.]